MAERSAGDNVLARAFPPNLPSATAFGFFFAPMAPIISLSGKVVKEKETYFLRLSHHSPNRPEARDCFRKS